MSKNYLWWLVELLVWYFFFYAILFAIKNPVSISWMAFVILLLASLGTFASPLTRHLSIWNKVLDKIVKKERDKMEF
jgi:hypothetical protein